jgi:hypothetical protein
MNVNDIVMVNVTGTNGSTRHQKNVSRQFSGAGIRLTDDGKPDTSSGEVLRNLPTGASTAAPDFPAAKFAEIQALTASKDGAVKAKAVADLKALNYAFAEQVQKWEKASGGGDENLQIAKSVLAYAKEFHDFRETDGDWFVMKLENLDVTQIKLNDGRSMFQVTGTAVFGK